MVTKVSEELADTSNRQSRRSQQDQLQCTLKMDSAGSSEIMVQSDRREPDVFEMISTHLFFNEKAILLQKNFRNCMPF